MPDDFSGARGLDQRPQNQETNHQRRCEENDRCAACCRLFCDNAGDNFGRERGAQGSSAKTYQKADDNANFKRQGDAEETDEQYQKNKRKRVEAMVGEAQGRGETHREKNRERKEGAEDD